MKKKREPEPAVSRCPKCRGDICDRYEICLAKYKKQKAPTPGVGDDHKEI